ncbi:hypothetical protein EW145_g497 [Phellinidium pouzarii]|uniref:RRM domain-containing protein n=1 Tax=Phellinidium pouzarii TaxID=167371 RepID=A0A4S4LI31_9AGAM|nr:hypothetical protein EW145_g497 [Phellinidium pouzarii]
MSQYLVKVSNVAPATSKEKLHDFFTFCGKIESIDFEGSEGVSTIYFEKPSAVTTALMLDQGTLDGTQLSVKSDEIHPDDDHESPHSDGAPFAQSDKPRAGIAAEYLAKGYTLSDQILQRAIELDHQKGISSRFLSYFQTLDSTIGSKALGPDQTVTGKVQATLNSATDRARSVDEQRGISKSAHDQYYSWAVQSPLGQKVTAFYTTTAKQVLDIHEEARRISDSHSRKAAATSPTNPAGEASAPVSVAVPDAAVAGPDSATLTT